MAAADVGDARAGAQLRLHPVERGDPRLDQVAEVGRAEEPLDAVEHAVIVLVPADALAGAERLGEPVDDPAGRDRGLEGADDEGRAVLVGEGHRLLGRQRVAARLGVVGHIARGGLRVQPLADVALGGGGLRGEGRGGERAVGRQGTEQAQAVADHDQRGDVGAAEVDDGAAEQLVQLLLVDDGRGGAGWGARVAVCMVEALEVGSWRWELAVGGWSCPKAFASTASLEAPSTSELCRAGERLARSATRHGRLRDRPRHLPDRPEHAGPSPSTRHHGRPVRTPARGEALRRDVLRRRVLEAVARHLAAGGDARPLPGARREPRHRVPPGGPGHRLHQGRHRDDAVRRRRPADGAARRRARDGQRRRRAAVSLRAGHGGAALRAGCCAHGSAAAARRHGWCAATWPATPA